jgi:hypothetical protein
MGHKYRAQLESFMEKAKYNNKYSDRIVGKALLFSNVWTSLISPVLIGLGISYLFGLESGKPPSFVFLALAAIFLLVHLAIAYLVHQNNSKYSLYSQAIDLEDSYSSELHTIRNDHSHLLQAYKTLSNLHSNQMTSLFISSYITDIAIGEINQKEDAAEKLEQEEITAMSSKQFSAIIRTLSMEREELFGYKSDSLYNICLYLYNNDSDSLEVVSRDCDNRLPQRNRSWKPGHGHVGLAFLHKEIKICPDITKSNELGSNAIEGEDNKHYRSFISIPILRCDDNGDVNNDKAALGVLVLTSSKADQFDEGRDLQFLSTISKYLAIYIATFLSYITHNKRLEVEPEKGVKDE